MSASTSFLIGPVKDGVRKDLKPWATPEDSFEYLLNCYQFRGRVVRRQGYTLLGKLANGTPVMGLKTQEQFGINLQTLIAFDLTTSYEWNGSAFVTLPSVMPVTWSGTDYQFFYTANYANAFWATNSKPGLNGWALSVPGGGNTTFDNSAGTGNAATVQVYSTGNAVAVGDYVYFLNLVSGVRGNAAVLAIVTIAGNPFTVQATNLPASSTFAWTDGDSATGIVLDSMKTITGQDGIRYYGVLSNGTGWANYNPPLDLDNALAGALLIFPYRGYLVFLNTTEGNESGVDNYPNRARWIQIGTPYYSAPQPVFPNVQGIDINAGRDDLFGRGGANDAPTNESIVGAAFIRDILVVYFTRSTWRLRFVNNAQNPFVWERVNIELGSDCTGSTIPFDKGLMAIGNRGIVISDGNDTQRFDEKIPDEIFNIRANNFGFNRVQGIRTFRSKLNFWTIPSASINQLGTYPDLLLVFNYDTKAWSVFDDIFTCFGYLYPTGSGETWADLTNSWSSYGSLTWGEGSSASGFEQVIAGNQQGYVFQLEMTDGQNAPSLGISAITAADPGVFTSVNNNQPDGTWIQLSGVTGTTSADGVSLNGRNFKMNKSVPTDNTFTLSEFKSIAAGNAVGTSFSYPVDYVPILPGSVQVNVGALVFKDVALDGVLVEASSLGVGAINYETGLLSLTFSPAIGSSAVNIRVVSYDNDQGLSTVATTGVYGGGGEIAKISNIEIDTKIFNFFKNDQGVRLSKIDFYVDRTSSGQFTVDVLGDSSNVPINTPLSDNPQQNVVLTTANQYQVGSGTETIYRLYCDAVAQTIQLSMYFSDQQMAVSAINRCDVELLAMMFSATARGRII